MSKQKNVLLNIPQIYNEWQKTADSLSKTGSLLSMNIKEIEIGLEMNTLSTERVREIFKHLITVKDKKISIEEIDIFYRWYVVIDRIVVVMSSAKDGEKEKLEKDRLAIKKQIVSKWEETIRQIGDQFEALKYWQKFFEAVDIDDKDKKLADIVRNILLENFPHGYLSIFNSKNLKKMSLTFLGNFFESVSSLPNQRGKFERIQNIISETLENIDIDDDSESDLMLDIIYYYNNSKSVSLVQAYNLLNSIRTKIKDLEKNNRAGLYKDQTSFFIKQQEKYNLLYLEILTLIVNLEDKSKPDFDEKIFEQFLNYLQCVSIDNSYFLYAAAVFKYAFRRNKVETLDKKLGLRESTFLKSEDSAKFNLGVNRARFEAVLELAEENICAFSYDMLQHISNGNEDMRLALLSRIAVKFKSKNEYLALALKIKNRAIEIIGNYQLNHENTHSYLVALEATMILKKAGIKF